MRLLSLLLMSLAFLACKRQPITNIPSNPVEITNNTQDSTKQVSQPVGKHFRYLKTSAKVEYQDAQNNVSFKVHLRMRKDSAMWVSISKMGIQGLRVLITPDSVRILNYQENEYSVAPFDTLHKIFNFPIDFQMLQAVVLADMPLAYDSTQVQSENGLRKITQQRNNITITNFLNQHEKLQNLHLKDLKTSNLLQWLYQDFKNFNGNWFAEKNKISMQYWDKKTRQNQTSTVEMDYNEVHFLHQAIEMPFNVPSKFKRK